MRTSIKSLNTYKLLATRNCFEKVGEQMLSEYAPDRARMSEQIYDDVEQMGGENRQSPVNQEMMQDYQPEMAAPQAEGYSPDQGGAPEGEYQTEQDYFNNLTPQEYLSLLSAMDQSGMGMAFGANNFYDDMYDPQYKMGSEKYASLMNEVMKIGRANHVIKEMAQDPKQEKVAFEMDLINKDYFCDVMSELVGVGQEREKTAEAEDNKGAEMNKVAYELGQKLAAVTINARGEGPGQKPKGRLQAKQAPKEEGMSQTTRGLLGALLGGTMGAGIGAGTSPFGVEPSLLFGDKSGPFGGALSDGYRRDLLKRVLTGGTIGALGGGALGMSSLYN